VKSARLADVICDVGEIETSLRLCPVDDLGARFDEELGRGQAEQGVACRLAPAAAQVAAEPGGHDR
jgi:hypothetical protein